MKSLRRCRYCGRYYRPDPRMGEKQKSCFRAECKKRRKEESQRRWIKANPGYYKGRYENTKAWRETHPGYQKQYRARRRDEIQDAMLRKSPVKTIRLAVPVKVLEGEIQDEIRLTRQCGCGFWLSGVATRDTRRDGLSPPG